MHRIDLFRDYDSCSVVLVNGLVSFPYAKFAHTAYSDPCIVVTWFYSIN